MSAILIGGMMNNNQTVVQIDGMMLMRVPSAERFLWMIANTVRTAELRWIYKLFILERRKINA